MLCAGQGPGLGVPWDEGDPEEARGWGSLAWRGVGTALWDPGEQGL